MWSALAWLGLFSQDPRTAFDAPSIVLDPVYVPNWGDAGRFNAVGDFNGDGKPDLIGEWGYEWGWAHQVIKVWYGNGTGGFFVRRWQEDLVIAESEEPELTDGFVEVGNFGTPDGREDFIHAYNEAIAGQVTAVVRLFQGTSVNPSLFRTLRFPGRLLDVELGDWDGNGTGDPAVLVAGADGKRRLRVLLGASTVVDLPVPPGAWSQLEPGEFTGGGGLDLALVGPSGVVLRSLAKGGKAQHVPAVIEHGLVNPDSAAGDVDGDGRDDVVLFTRAGYRILRQPQPGRFELGPLSIGGPATELADIDNDGDLDGICCGGGGGPHNPTYEPRAAAKFELSFNDGSGNFSPSFSLPSLASEHIAGAVDFDRDGDVDLVAGRTIYFNPGEIRPRLEFPRELTALMPASLGDIDGDGDPDFELALSGCLLNDGDGRARAATPAMPAPPAGAAFTGPGLPGDFDADGTLDLLVEASGASSGLHLLRNRGGGSFDDAGVLVTPSAPYSTRTALDARSCRLLDLDGDGDQDLIVRADASRSLASQFIDVWLNQGAGAFASGQSLAHESLFEVGDLDQDGVLDLAVLWGSDTTNTAKGRLYWHRGRGDGTFYARQLIWDAQYGFNFEAEEEPCALTALGTPAHHALVSMRPGAGVYRYERSGTSWLETELPAFFRTEYYGADSVPVKTWFRTTDVNLDGREDLLAWPTIGLGTAFGFSTSAGLPTTGARLLMEPRAFADVDGDGDPDALSTSGIVLNRTRAGSSAGMRVQFGSGCAGTGGLAPVLGARGPFVVGTTVELRIRGGRGGAVATLARARTRAERSDWPVIGVTSFVDPDDAFFETTRVTLDGPAGVAGAGSATVSFTVPADLASVREYYQVWIADPAAPGGVAASQGLELSFGN